jgi:DNA-binding NarL/FixJ family response regulator
MQTVRILIVDDHEIIHGGIKDILKSVEDFDIIGHAYNGDEAIEMATELKPDLIFMDISMPKTNGIEAIKVIKNNFSQIRIIAITQHEDLEYVSQVLSAGAEGYLLKNSKKEDFIDAIASVLKNKRFLSAELADQMINSTLEKKTKFEANDEIHLTRREIEIIQKIADDKSNQEIADELNISLRTVETHRRNLMQKLKVKSVVAMMKYAAAKKIISF